MKKLLNSLISFCKRRRKEIINFILVLAAFAFTLTLIVNGSYIKQGYDAKVNSIADRDFFATADLINEAATGKLMEEAVSGVSDIYVHNGETDKEVTEEINAFFDNLLYEDYEEAFEDSAAPVGITENIFITEAQYRYIKSLSYGDREMFKDRVMAIAENSLAQGIRNETMDTALTAVKSSVDVLQYSAAGTDAAFNIISSALKPNLYIDTEATEKAKEERRAQVEPVKVLAGQKIVGEGEVITQEIYDLLDKSGFLKKEGFKENIVQIAGIFILLVILFALSARYIQTRHRALFGDVRYSVLLFTLYMLLIGLTYFMGRLSVPYMFAPVFAFTMLAAIFFGSDFAFFMNLIVSLAAMFIYKGDISFVVFFWLGGSIIVLTLRLAGERNRILLCGILNSAVFTVIMIGIQMFFNIYWKKYIVSYSAYTFLSGIISIILCMGSLPLFESAFGIVTDYKLQELTGSNQKLMRRLMIEAPGTYHHCLIAANLAEAAAYSIGANPSLARAGACYHDIGKLARPMYFAENMHGSNIHDRLSPYKSAEIIKSHVTDGEETAKRYRLPRVITDIVKEHHGTSLIKFFYYKQKKAAEENPEISKPDEAAFRYGGPLPSTKESGIIMLADTVEAAVRSSISKGMTMEEVKEFIDTLIKDKLKDGQLNSCPLTMGDLDKISEAFLEIFKGMYHERVAYPKVNTG